MLGSRRRTLLFDCMISNARSLGFAWIAGIGLLAPIVFAGVRKLQFVGFAQGECDATGAIAVVAFLAGLRPKRGALAVFIAAQFTSWAVVSIAVQ